MRHVAAILVSFTLVTVSGCGALNASRDISDGSIKQFTPSGKDYRDDANDRNTYHDDYAIVGKEGRGDQQRERESDGLTRYISSPKARAIEKNCGID